MSKYFSSLLLPFFILNSNLFGLLEGTLGRIDASTTVSTTYDSRVFGVSSGDFSQIRSNQGTNSNLRSEDDFILLYFLLPFIILKNLDGFLSVQPLVFN